MSPAADIASPACRNSLRDDFDLIGPPIPAKYHNLDGIFGLDSCMVHTTNIVLEAGGFQDFLWRLLALSPDLVLDHVWIT